MKNEKLNQLDTKQKKYIEEHLLSASPLPCTFKVGDVVAYTNSYGVVFEGRIIIGFSGKDSLLFQYGKFIHLHNDAYWHPVTADSLKIEVK